MQLAAIHTPQGGRKVTKIKSNKGYNWVVLFFALNTSDRRKRNGRTKRKAAGCSQFLTHRKGLGHTKTERKEKRGNRSVQNVIRQGRTWGAKYCGGSTFFAPLHHSKWQKAFSKTHPHRPYLLPCLLPFTSQRPCPCPYSSPPWPRPSGPFPSPSAPEPYLHDPSPSLAARSCKVVRTRKVPSISSVIGRIIDIFLKQIQQKQGRGVHHLLTLSKPTRLLDIFGCAAQSPGRVHWLLSLLSGH